MAAEAIDVGIADDIPHSDGFAVITADRAIVHAEFRIVDAIADAAKIVVLDIHGSAHSAVDSARGDIEKIVVEGGRRTRTSLLNILSL